MTGPIIIKGAPGISEEEYVSPPGVCPLCLERSKTWKGSNPKCAYPEDHRHSMREGNWNCATLNKLRQLCDPFSDENLARRITLNTVIRGGDLSIGILWVPESPTRYGDSFTEPEQAPTYDFFIIMQWYENRGKVSKAFCVDHATDSRPLTFARAMAAIRRYEAAKRREEAPK